MDRNQAGESLAAIASAKQAVAAASAAPLWRHGAFGGVMGTIVMGMALDTPLNFALLAAAMAGIAWLVHWDRKQTGMFVNGYRRGPTLPLTIALLVSVLGLGALAARLGNEGESALALLPGVAAFLIAFGASLWWERIFMREMGARR